MPNTANEIHNISEDEERNVAVDCQGLLDGAEVLTGTPTVTEVGTSHLAFSNQAVSSAILSINGTDVPIGKAVQFKASAVDVTVKGHVSIDIRCSTDAGQVVGCRVRLDLN